jgi:CubicO group peptidase (beta-lactamase class C family)
MDHCEAEEVGLSKERLERIRPKFQALIDSKRAPGFQLAVARRGKLAFIDRMGWMDVEGKIPVGEDSIFRLYSMTKPIATAALMILYEEGKIGLEEPVWRYIPAFKDLKVYAGQERGRPLLEPMRRAITILDLTLHCAGLGYGLFDDSPVEELYRRSGIFREGLGVMKVPLREFIDALVQLPLANQPGARWRYSVAVDVIGYLVELVSGLPFDVFLKERIFLPLGMADTGFFVPPEKLGRFAALYTPAENGEIRCIDRGAASPFAQSTATPSGGGGLVSTIRDYLRFDRMMLGGGESDGVRILGRKTVEKMTRNHLAASLLPRNMGGIDSPGCGFGPGYGICLDEAQSGMAISAGSYYWGGAASTFSFVDPSEDLIGIMMTQVIDNQLPFDQYFRQLLSQAIID